MRFIRAVVFVLVLAIIIVAAFIVSGIYRVGADESHWAITERALNLLRNRSIETQAQGITVPNLDDPKRVAEGGEHYAAMCTGCHLAPGMQNSDLREGLYPRPPSLVKVGVRDPAQAFWIIKHGVKLTAMPAWGKSHDDDSIWGLVAFIKQLPQMTPEQYQKATAGAGQHEHHHDDNGTSTENPNPDHVHAGADHGGAVDQ